MAEKVQHPHAPRHRNPRLHLHRGLHPVNSTTGGGSHRRRGRRQGERLDGEGGGHVLCPAGVDGAGGDEHEADLLAGVDELQGAVVVGERGAVRVPDGGVLGEREVDGAVWDGEGREPDGADGDLGVLRPEEYEVNDENGDEDENQEDGGNQTRRQVGAPWRRRSLRLRHHGWVSLSFGCGGVEWSGVDLSVTILCKLYWSHVMCCDKLTQKPHVDVVCRIWKDG